VVYRADGVVYRADGVVYRVDGVVYTHTHTHTHTHTGRMEWCTGLDPSHFVLDICLDFFSCDNPFEKMFEAGYGVTLLLYTLSQ
jgi:hypothetical protein